MSAWLKRAMVALLVVVACGTTSSGATYTATSNNPQTFTASNDFGLSVEMDDPGPTMRGSRSMSATPTVTDGVAVSSVAIQRSPAGSGSWTTICTDVSATGGWSCTLDTTTLTDGLYDFRARATNANGYSRHSTTAVDSLVDNSGPSITMEDPGVWFRATLALEPTSLGDGGGSGVADVQYQYKLSSTGTWSTACTASSSPFSCSFATGSLTDGSNYDFRAVATDVAGNSTTSTAFTNRKPDNVAPSGSLSDPGSFLRAVLALTLTASDAHSGVESVAVQWTAAGGSTWTTGCVDTTAPFEVCAWDTTSAPDGLVDVRTLITDVAGNTLATSVMVGRRIDNTLPTADLADPGSPLSGSLTLTGSADDVGGSGVADVKFQRSPAGTGSWTTICSDPSASYSCLWNTTSVPEGLYDLRALATDNAGNTNSTTVANRRVDNLVPSASDVQTADSSGTPDGLIESGDSITLTYSEEIDPASIVAGWNGSGSQSIHVRSTHAGGALADKLLFYNAANNAVLPLAGGVGVSLGGDYVPNTNPVWTATLTRSANGRAFTVTFGTRISGGAPLTVAASGTMQWIPSAGALDMAAKACSTTPKGETGAPDREF